MIGVHFSCERLKTIRRSCYLTTMVWFIYCSGEPSSQPVDRLPFLPQRSKVPVRCSMGDFSIFLLIKVVMIHALVAIVCAASWLSEACCTSSYFLWKNGLELENYICAYSFDLQRLQHYFFAVLQVFWFV